MEINRRSLLSGFVVSGGLFLTSCTNRDPEPTPTEQLDPRQKVADEAEEAVTNDEGIMVFGESNARNELAVILDFYSPESSRFFNQHLEELRKLTSTPEKIFGVIILTDIDEEPDPVQKLMLTWTTSVGLLVHQHNQAKFWDYAEDIFARDGEPFTNQMDIIELGLKHGVPDSEHIRYEVDGPQMMVQLMSGRAESYLPEKNPPAIVINREVWTGDINNSMEASAALNYFDQ